MKRKILPFAVLVFLLSILISGTIKAQPLAGLYTINSALVTGGTNFQSFNDFATSININGISASVIATVEPGSGPYHEQVAFRDIPGAGSGATVTLEGSGETITAVTTTADRHVVRLTDIQFFTINNLHVVRDIASTGGFYGIHIFRTGSDITITNCTIDINGTNSTLHGSIVASGDTASILVTGNFHRLNIHGNTCISGGYGVSVFGMVSNLASDIVISENDILDFSDNGVYLRETNGAVIRDNHFDKRTSNVTSTNAIQIAQAANLNANIYNNVINISQTSNGTMTIRGIYLFNGTGHKVYNNVISDVRLTSGNFTAIEVRTGSTSPNIYFNTISLDDTDTTSGNLYGIKEELSNTNSELRNNMISISQASTGIKSGILLGNTTGFGSGFNSDFNNIYVPGGNVAMKGTTSPTLYPTLSDWQIASTLDINSYSLAPMFSSLITPVPTNLSLDNKGLLIAGYTSDILGNLRSSTPDIGAYEFIGTGLNEKFYNFSIELFPNPVMIVLNFRLPESTSTALNISVFNRDGKMVIENAELFSSVSKTFQFNIEALSPGLYFVQCVSDNKVFHSNFVKVQK